MAVEAEPNRRRPQDVHELMGHTEEQESHRTGLGCTIEPIVASPRSEARSL